jgi:hypothetical protein
MDGGFTMWDAINLGVAVLGLVVASAIATRDFLARQRKLVVFAEFGTAPLGRISNHSFFIVRLVNVRERPIGVSEIEFSNERDTRIGFEAFRQLPELPATLGDHQEGRVLYDPDRAAGWIIDLGMRAVYVRDAEGKEWRAEIPRWAIDEAREIQEYAPPD